MSTQPIQVIERSSFNEDATVKNIPIKKIKKVKLYEKIGKQTVEDLIRNRQSKKN